MRLETYDISEDMDMLNAKLLTSKRGGCDGGHCMEEGSLGSFRCCWHQHHRHTATWQSSCDQQLGCKATAGT